MMSSVQLAIAACCLLSPSAASVARAGIARVPHASRAHASMLFNSDRSRRSASAGDRKVTLKKPLGLELIDGPGNSVVVRARAAPVCVRARASSPAAAPCLFAHIPADWRRD